MRMYVTEKSRMKQFIKTNIFFFKIIIIIICAGNLTL